MKTVEGRYVVCDESRAAPNNVEVRADGSGTVYWGEDGECEWFDDLHEAIRFAREVWDRSEQGHRVFVRDREDAGKVVWFGDVVLPTPIEER